MKTWTNDEIALILDTLLATRTVAETNRFYRTLAAHYDVTEKVLRRRIWAVLVNYRDQGYKAPSFVRTDRIVPWNHVDQEFLKTALTSHADGQGDITYEYMAQVLARPVKDIKPHWKKLRPTGFGFDSRSR